MGGINLRVKRIRFIGGAYYWQPTPSVRAMGFAAEALGKDPLKAAARAQELNRLVDEARRSALDKQFGPTPGTMADLITRYRKSRRFADLAKATQETYGQSMDFIEAKAGRLIVAKITRPELVKMYRDLQPRGLSVAHKHMRCMRMLLGFAYDEGLRADNPARGLRLVTPPSRRQVWLPRQVERFCLTADLVGRPEMALAIRLALDTGQRPGDIRQLTWSEWDGIAFTIRQGKTGTVVRVPVSAELQQHLNNARDAARSAVQIVVSAATGRPYGKFNFVHVFARIRQAARLPKDLQFRDFRRTAATELGAAGATDDEIRAVTGHQSREVVKIYVRPDGRMAKAGQEKRFRNKAASEV